MKTVRFIIQGEPASKANQRRLVTSRKTGKALSIKSEKALNYRATALLQIPMEARAQMVKPVAVRMEIYYRSNRPDLDESLILDILQDQYAKVGDARVLTQRGVYCNDRQVKEKHVFHHLDKQNPRTEITVSEID